MNITQKTPEAKKMIRNFIDSPLPTDWENYDLEARRAYWRSEKKTGNVKRTRVCPLEIWLELFEGEESEFNPSISREINAIIRQLPLWRPSSSVNCGPLYGRQRGFVFDYLLSRMVTRSGT